MTMMLDRWHDAYHAEAPDYTNCPYCRDELVLTDPAAHVDDSMPEGPHDVEWGVWLETTYDPDVQLADRIEDLEI